MKYKAQSIEEYIQEVAEEKRPYFLKLREAILENLPEGFRETFSYGMIGYVVPHELYRNGYHCDPKLPLPFINIAAQKHHIALYHNGLYAKPELMEWFKSEYPKYSSQKPDISKSCWRFKKYDQIPYQLVGKLLQKISVNEWIQLYEQQIKGKK
ncbi:MAG: DUF1801 domain-containing protein [Calditrichia bacterium]